MKGYIQVYTGDGKGKTTAALGLALRAAGAGFYTFIGQFLKGQHYSELKTVRFLHPFLTIEQFGKKTFIHEEKWNKKDRDMALAGLQRIQTILMQNKHNIVVLDEINITVALGLLNDREVLDVLSHKPQSVEVVLTGRSAPQSLIDAADVVTEMIEIKHYFHQGVQARVGIEK
jgi:cob(I)alamin adenosyltransferase